MAPRGKNFEPAEERQLSLSYIHIGQDPLVGVGQKNARFWERVAEHYNKHMPVGGIERSQESLETKFNVIKKDVAKFCSIYNQVVDLNESGTSAEDILNKALKLYKEKHSKNQDFKSISSWLVLKDFPKFSAVQIDSNMKRRQAQPLKDVTNETVMLEDSDTDFSAPNDDILGDKFTRPIGNKKAKAELEKQKGIASALLESAKAGARMVAALEEKVKILKEQQSVFKEQSLMQLFGGNDNLLSEEGKEYFKLRREIELRKYKLEIAQEDAVEDVVFQSVPSEVSPVQATEDPFPSATTSPSFARDGWLDDDEGRDLACPDRDLPME